MILTIHLDEHWKQLGLKKENFSDKWNVEWIESMVAKVNA